MPAAGFEKQSPIPGQSHHLATATTKNKTALRLATKGGWLKLSGYLPTAFSSGIRMQ
jgi:hypothetical protein